jgi:GR25 family glycosyltransferase involved in LPS biosynthesis
MTAHRGSLRGPSHLLFYLLICCLRTFHGSAQQLNVINVRKDVERWHRVVQEFELKGIPIDQIQRLEAVDGKALSEEELKENASSGARLFCTPGTIGCYISHRNFWEQTLQGEEPYQIIFEDDVVLVDDFYNLALQRVAELEEAVGPDSWDVLLLGGLGCVNPNRRYGSYNIPAFVSGGRRTPRMISEHVHIPKRPFGTHAYVLSKRGAEKLLRLAWKATYHVDCVIWGMKELDLFISHPLLVYQDSSPSTVGAITSGPETWIPSSIKMDDYTKMSLEWVWNEAIIRIPWVNVIITQGRYMLMGILGTAIGIWQFGNHPWILPAYVSVYLTFIVSFNRLINRPIGRP